MLIVKTFMKALTSFAFTIYQIDRFIGGLSVSLKLWLKVFLKPVLKQININVKGSFVLCVYTVGMHIVVIG